MEYQQILENIYQAILPFSKEGKQADYIPALAKVDPDQFGMCIHTIYGEIYSIEQETTLTYQSNQHFEFSTTKTLIHCHFFRFFLYFCKMLQL